MSLQHLTQVVQEAVEGLVVIAAIAHADQHHTHIVQDVYHLA